MSRHLPGLVAALVFTIGWIGVQTPAPFDLLLRGGRIVDGTGSPWFRGDLAVRGDTIVAIAPRIDAPAARVIELNGAAVAPGFIDTHTHARRGIDANPTAHNYIRQGVTTVIEGPDGSSPWPLGEFLDGFVKTPRSVNIGAFVGQGSIREAVIGTGNRKATPDEIAKMQAMVEQAMREGAFGLSTGLFYVPGTFTTTDEVVALAEVAGRLGGMHVSHQRDEASRVMESVHETIAIGERGHLPTQITHAKVIGKGNWGQSVQMLRLVDEARARGVDVTIDQYPYTASSTSVSSALIPAWALEGGRAAQQARFADPATRAKILTYTRDLIQNERGGGDPKNVQLASCSFDPTLAGKTLADVMVRRGLPATMEAAAEATLWIVEQGGCQGIFHAMNEDDLKRILAHPATMIASDGEVPTFGRANPHPRSYGTFVRVLGRYVREQHVITLEDAVRKMTSFPAARLGVPDRGILRNGLKADLVVFDPATVRDLATFENPHQYAEGISLVVVNGKPVVDGGTITGARPGVVLYGPARR